MKILNVVSVILLLLIMSATGLAKRKTGTIVISSNVPVTVEIFRKDPATIIYRTTLSSPSAYVVEPGEYSVIFTLFDTFPLRRPVIVKKNCTTRLDLYHTPPNCPICVPKEIIKEKIIEREKPAEIPKPELKPELFDRCCECKRDELKARLDLFAVELHRNPTTRGQLMAAPNWAIDYLVNERKVDRSRLLIRDSSKCVELWILQK